MVDLGTDVERGALGTWDYVLGNQQHENSWPFDSDRFFPSDSTSGFSSSSSLLPWNLEGDMVIACNQAALNQCKSDTCIGIRVLLVTSTFLELGHWLIQCKLLGLKRRMQLCFTSLRASNSGSGFCRVFGLAFLFHGGFALFGLYISFDFLYFTFELA
jgi:hypothetical protein